MAKKSRLYGDWNSVAPKIKVIKQKLPETMVEEAQNLGKKYNDRVREHVGKQNLPLEPLALSTMAKKGDDKWWYETGIFVDKLSVRVYYKGKGSASVRVGALRERKYNDYFNMEELASILEYGNSHIIGRPLFGMTDVEFESEFRELGVDTDKIVELVWNKKGLVTMAAALSAWRIAENRVMKE